MEYITVKYDIYFTNIITEIFGREPYFKNVEHPFKYPFKINYGNFRVKFIVYKDLKNNILYFTTYLSIPWIHIGIFQEYGKECIPKGICIGEDLRSQIYQILRKNYSQEKEKSLIKIILKDYFSVGLYDHWCSLGVPYGVKEITKKDLFICQISSRPAHKNIMSEYIHNVRKEYNFKRNNFLGPKKSIIHISDYRRCTYCGNYTLKTSKIKCESCNTNG